MFPFRIQTPSKLIMSDAAAPAQDAPKQEEDSRKVNLVSMDGDSFEVSRSVAAMSELVKTLVSGA